MFYTFLYLFFVYNSSLQSRIQGLEEERLVITSQLAAKREESLSQQRDLVILRENVSNLEGKLLSKEVELQAGKESLMQLEVERELRARCEIREEAERRERIAANAQLMAIQSEVSIALHLLFMCLSIHQSVTSVQCASTTWRRRRSKMASPSDQNCRSSDDSKTKVFPNVANKQTSSWDWRMRSSSSVTH